MKALVTYYSESGNTEKLANAIYEGLDATNKEIAKIGEKDNFDSAVHARACEARA